MSRAKNKLTAVAIKKAKPGKMDDGGGLRLYKLEATSRWVYRYSIAGQRREMGLGSLSDVTLAAARKERDRWAGVLAEGKDPISERDRLVRQAAEELDRHDPTFQEMAEALFEAKKPSLRAEGERGRWFSPLRVHVIPKIGNRRIATITRSDIVDVLRPIWKSKHSTAIKAYNRTHMVFKHARLTIPEVDPFTVEAAKHILGDVNAKVEHIASTPWQDIPDLYAKLEGPGFSRLCLRWMILTAARSESARGARFDEIDGSVWTIPAERMKGNEGSVQDFRVPLSAAALALLAEIEELRCSEYMFPSSRGSFITSTAIAKPLNVLKEPGRPHGFRTSFRTWVQDTEVASFDVAETALAHRIGNRVERVYARSDLLDRRHILMDRWGRFVTKAEGTVVQMHA